jgi:hypothetical protein
MDSSPNRSPKTSAKLIWADGRESLFEINLHDTVVLQIDTAGTRHWFHMTGHVDDEGYEIFIEREADRADRGRWKLSM